MGFIRFCVDRPVTVWMMIILLAMLGVLSLVYMDVELLPNISVPTLVVITKMPKAGPSEIEEKISRPLEEILNTVSDLKSLSSRSKEGISQVKLEFQWAKNVDLAIMEVKEKLYKARLPEESETPYIWRWDPSSEPIFRFDLYDRTGKMSLPQMKDLAEKKVKPRVERIKGVGSVTILGGQEREFKVLLSGKSLKEKYLTILQVIDAIHKENANLKAGKIESERNEYLVRVIGKSRNKEELGNIVVATRKHKVHGKTEQIFLKDIAQIEDTYEEASSYARINGNISIGLSIKKTSGGNVVNVIDSIKTEVEKLRGYLEQMVLEEGQKINDAFVLEVTRNILKKNGYHVSPRSTIHNLSPEEWMVKDGLQEYFVAKNENVVNLYVQDAAVIPANVNLVVSRDDSEYIMKSQSIVVSNIFQGVLLAVVLVLFFVRDIRGAILLAQSIPFSIIAAFSLLYCYGLSRNILTLGGMALAAGMVLDCSIVILENIHKHIEYGKNLRFASIEGTGEVAMGMVTSSLTTVLVFLPLLFTKGIIREIFKDLSLAIIAAIIFSTVIGLIFMPMMGARIIKPKQKISEMFFLKKMVMTLLARFDALMEKALEILLKIGLASGLGRVCILVVLILAAFIGIVMIPSKDFIPRGKVKEIKSEIETPQGSTLSYTDEKAREVEKALSAFKIDSFPDKKAIVETVTAEVYSESAIVFLKIAFVPKEIQVKAPPTFMDKVWDVLSIVLGGGEGVQYTRDEVLLVVEKLREMLKALPGNAEIMVNVLEKVNPQGAIPMKVSIVAKDPISCPLSKVREYVKQQIIPQVKEIPGSIYFRIARAEPVPELEIELNKQGVSDLGGDSDTITKSVRCFINGYIASSIEVGDEEIDIRVQGVPQERGNAEEIAKLPLLTPRSTYLTIGTISDIRTNLKESQIERKDKKPTIVLQCNQIPYSISGKTLGTIMESLDLYFSHPAFPKSAPAGEKFKDLFIYNYEGQAKDLIESSDNALFALITSIILIYMVMCCQFESLLNPLVIMITVPLSFPGIAWLLYLTSEEYSLSAMVGFICLGGVVVNNGIILIEFVNILREQGMELREALIEASKRKLRSILITSFTSVLGMLPIVMGVGEGSELYRGCCSVILGGLLVSTPLTLLAVPILYMLMEDAKELISIYTLKLTLLFTQKTTN